MNLNPTHGGVELWHAVSQELSKMIVANPNSWLRLHKQVEEQLHGGNMVTAECPMVAVFWSAICIWIYLLLEMFLHFTGANLLLDYVLMWNFTPGHENSFSEQP